MNLLARVESEFHSELHWSWLYHWIDFSYHWIVLQLHWTVLQLHWIKLQLVLNCHCYFFEIVLPFCWSKFANNTHWIGLWFPQTLSIEGHIWYHSLSLIVMVRIHAVWVKFPAFSLHNLMCYMQSKKDLLYTTELEKLMHLLVSPVILSWCVQVQDSGYIIWFNAKQSMH